MSTIFGKIISGAVTADKVFENERILAFHDIHPVAPVHILIVSKKEIPDLQSVTPADMPIISEMIQVAQQLAKEFNIADGYRLVTNSGAKGGQTIFHFHFHLIGGRQLGSVDG
jgi:histidine triad (HIT) family protein